MKLHHFKVGSRLGLGFGTVCALLVLIVGVGWNGLGRLKAQTDNIVHEDSPRLSMVSEAAIHVLNIDIALRNLLLSDDDAQRAGQTAIVQKEAELARRNLDRLQALTHFPEGQALVRKIMDQRARYIDGRQHLFDLVEAGSLDEARAYLNRELRPMSEAYQVALNDMVVLLTHRVQEAGRAADEAHAGARGLMLSLGAAALLVAAVLGWLIARGLLRQLGGEPVQAAGIAGRIAEGDLAVDVPVKAGDADSLMAAMKHMRDSLARLVGEVRGGAESIASAAEQISVGNLDLSSRTEEQASSLAETAATMEEITATVRQNADNAQQ
ncbi:methyl-accepting chemotaxis protein, partial [Castellaniella denitrificans]|uniref:methyl-accepting chemotaxis protein n=1 Tax=Castellaniella denitrificans TaxID=56119 RepID=UPI0039F102D9